LAGYGEYLTMQLPERMLTFLLGFLGQLAEIR